MNEERQQMVRDRFHLRNGQFFATYGRKNLWWYLNDEEFGFGDLRESDIFLIQCALEPGEVFKGYHEGHMTPFMQGENPIIVINSVEVRYPKHIPVLPETWKIIDDRQPLK
jgi:hypothetical protein